MIVRPPSPWVLDVAHCVHFAWCPQIQDEFTQPYSSVVILEVEPYLKETTTATEMLGNVARNDLSNGHSGPNMLSACQTCVVGVAKTEPQETPSC